MSNRQSKYKRIYLFLKRAFKGFLIGLSANKIKGRFHGPRVLVNSIPKSGTHLLDQLLEEFPLIRPYNGRTIRPEYMGEDKNLAQQELTKLIKKVHATKTGEYRRAHMPSSPELLASLENINDLKMVLIVRNPKAVVVSLFKYMAEIDTMHPSHEIINQFKTDEEKLIACIDGYPGYIDSVHYVYSQYVDWLNRDDTYVVKFEDLIGTKGGGDDANRHQNIARLAEFLEIDINDQDLQKIIHNVDNPKTSTFRSGRVDGWKQYFTPELERYIEDKLQGIEKKFGY